MWFALVVKKHSVSERVCSPSPGDDKNYWSRLTILSGSKDIPDGYWNVCSNCWATYKEAEDAQREADTMFSAEQEVDLREYLAGCKTVVLMTFTDAPTDPLSKWIPFNG